MKNCIRMKDSIIVIIFAIILLILSFYSMNGSMNWGDDNAAYINSGIAIATDQIDQQNQRNVILHPGPLPKEVNGKLVYVWGYPLLLSIVYKITGWDMIQYDSIYWYKVPAVICMPFLFITLYFFLKRRSRKKISLFISLLFCTTGIIFNQINTISPDFIFLAFSVLAFLMLEIYRDDYTGTDFKHYIIPIIYGVVLWYIKELRLNGIAIIAVCILGHIVWIIRKRSWQKIGFKKIRIIVYTVLPYLVCFLFCLISEKILDSATSNMSDFDRGNINDFISHFIAEVKQLGSFFYNLTGNHSWIITLFFLALFVVGFISHFMQEDHLIILFIGTILVVAALPYSDGVRYIYGCLPVVMVFVCYGIEQIIRITKQSSHKKIVTVFIACMIALAISLNLYNIFTGNDMINVGYSPYSESAKEVYHFIQQNTGDNEIIAFRKPRSLYLNTKKLSVNLKTDTVTVAQNRYLDNISWYLYYKKNDEMNTFFDHEVLLTTVFENDEFILYKVDLLGRDRL